MQARQIAPETIRRCTHEQDLRQKSFNYKTLSPVLPPIPVTSQHRTTGELKGIYDAYVKTCQRWHLSRGKQVALLGFPENLITGLRVLDGQLTPLNPDQEDRAKYIVGISLGLGTLFGENVNAELDWINQPRAKLGGKSPLDYMLEGHMINLFTIVEMVKRERGL